MPSLKEEKRGVIKPKDWWCLCTAHTVQFVSPQTCLRSPVHTLRHARKMHLDLSRVLYAIMVSGLEMLR